MNDRELLELAAKAAGIALVYKPFTHNGQAGAALTADGYWNPLTDDGDALRLSVKVGMELSADDEAGHAPFAYARVKGCGDSYVFEPIVDDPCRALRRAIVTAAAEVARTMTPIRKDEPK